MKEEIEEKEEGESFVCKINDYNIFVNKRQYTVMNQTTKERTKGNNGTPMGYYRSLSDALEDIRDQGMRKSVGGAKTLDVAISKMKGFDESFAKLLLPLRKLEK